MNTPWSLSETDTPQISESQIRAHLEPINRKLEAKNLQSIPINISDWIVENGMAHIYPDSISNYISELSDVIEAENSHRGETRKKIEVELTKARTLLRELKGKYEEGGYKANHTQTNALLRKLEENARNTSVEVELGKMLLVRKKTDKEGEKLLGLIQDCDTQISGIKIRKEKILQNIPDTFIKEIEDMLGVIHIKQTLMASHKGAKRMSGAKKRGRKGIATEAVAASMAIALGLIMTKNKPNPPDGNNQKNIPVQIDTTKLGGSKKDPLQNIVTGKFTPNFGPVIIPQIGYYDDSKRLADINKVITEAQFPTELPEITDQTLKTDLLRLFTQNMKDKMPDYIYNERSITGTLIKEQRFNWDDMTTEVDIIVRTKFNGEIRTTKKAKLVNQKDWKWKG